MSATATVDVVHQLAVLLDCKLDRRTIQILMALIDEGVNPKALAAAVRELRQQANELRLTATDAASSNSQQ